MNPLTYLTCEHCRREFSFTEQDRYYQPMLVDLHLGMHLQICEGVATQAFALVCETEAFLTAASERES